MNKKRVHGYDTYQDKIDEGIYEPGFINEFEDEVETSIDDIDVEAEKVSTDSAEAEAEAEDLLSDQPDVTIDSSIPEENLDMGGREDISSEQSKTQMGFINDIVKGYNNLIKNYESVPLDKATKEKIAKVYNMLQGIQN